MAIVSPLKASPPRRLSLADATDGTTVAPDWLILYGDDKIGKSTWSSEAPKPLFIRFEDRHHHIAAKKLPVIRDEVDEAGKVVEHGLPTFLGILSDLTHSAHDYQTIIIDTVTTLEPIVASWVCSQNGKSSLDDFGYGRGPNAALEEWRRIINALEMLRSKRGVGIHLLGHVQIRKFNSPDAAVGEFDRFQLQLHEKVAGLLRQRVDNIFFAQNEILSAVKDGRTKGISTGVRLMRTRRTAAWDAGNSLALPETMPFSYADYAKAKAKFSTVDPAELSTEVETLIPTLPPEHQVTAREYLAKAGTDRTKLAQLIDWIRARAAGV